MGRRLQRLQITLRGRWHGVPPFLATHHGSRFLILGVLRRHSLPPSHPRIHNLTVGPTGVQRKVHLRRKRNSAKFYDIIAKDSRLIRAVETLVKNTQSGPHAPPKYGLNAYVSGQSYDTCA